MLNNFVIVSGTAMLCSTSASVVHLSGYNFFFGSGQTWSLQCLTQITETAGTRAGQVTHPAHTAAHSCAGARVGRGSKTSDLARIEKTAQLKHCSNLIDPCTHLGAKSVTFSFVSDLPHRGTEVLCLQQPVFLLCCHLESWKGISLSFSLYLGVS